MAPKGGNAKKESGRAKKAENEAKKQDAAAADKERKTATEWADGAKSANKKQEEAEQKRREQLARKAEAARLLAEEEAAGPSKVKAAPKAATKKKGGAAAAGTNPRPAGPGALAAGGGLAELSTSASGSSKKNGPPTPPPEPESFTATGIDNMLDLMEVVNAKTDKASVGNQAAGIERHPERRFKAAFEAYQERELPNVKQEHPGLRLNQYKDLLYKQFQKSPDNPFNQVLVSYDASKEAKVEALQRQREQIEERLRDRS